MLNGIAELNIESQTIRLVRGTFKTNSVVLLLSYKGILKGFFYKGLMWRVIPALWSRLRSSHMTSLATDLFILCIRTILFRSLRSLCETVLFSTSLSLARDNFKDYKINNNIKKKNELLNTLLNNIEKTLKDY